MYKKKIRLQKYIAMSGYCSRRKAEDLIKRGKVKVNGKVVKEMGVHICVSKDRIQINDKYINIAPKFYIALYKPVGYVSTTRFFVGEKNIKQLINFKKRFFIVGRLDKNSEGLLLLTNDGFWANKIMHPRYGIEKEYLVVLDKKLDHNILNHLSFHKKVNFKDDVITIKKIKKKTNDIFSLVLTEGKKREIRRLFQKYNYKVLKLKRIRIGKLKLSNLKLNKGQWCFIDSGRVF